MYLSSLFEKYPTSLGGADLPSDPWAICNRQSSDHTL